MIMDYTTFLLRCATLGIFFAFAVVIPRVRMERRARGVLAEHPDAERTSVYLPLRSTWAWAKQREIDAKVKEMGARGWTFLRMGEVSPLRSIGSWGGGVTLQFIRV